MTNIDKQKRQIRFGQKKRYIDKQINLFKSKMHSEPKVPGKFAKMSYCNCGNPKCLLCANPRKLFGIPTVQEQKQDEYANSFSSTTYMKKIELFTGDYAFLSNFYLAEVEYEGIVYPSSKHAYQAAKSDNKDIRLEFSLITRPGMAKKLGRQIEVVPDWNRRKFFVMQRIVNTKFFSHPDLFKKLVSTGSAELIEGNYWGDTYWGVCEGIGKNNLGKILMGIRDNPLNLL